MIKRVIAALSEGRDLNREEAREAMRQMTRGEATDAQIAAFLMGLRMKGETAEELAGMAEGMREAALRLPGEGEGVGDNCGTGGDGRGTFNISTISAFISAGAGLRVAKHGNRSVSSRCGSADVLEELGVNIELTPEQAAACLDSVGMVFLFAPLFHPAMRHVMKARRDMGIPTVFNMLGPLANPAGVSFQLLGASSPKRAALLAGALAELGTPRGLVVHGSDGTDELTTAASNHVWEVKCGSVTPYLLDPRDLGLPRCRPEDLRGGDAAENARIAMRVLRGEKGPALDVCLLNAAALLLAGEAAEDLPAALRLARSSVEKGRALEKLRRLVEFTAACRGEKRPREAAHA